jgi:hypothetical protein
MAVLCHFILSVVRQFISAKKPSLQRTLEFRATRTGIRVVTREMADYSAIMRHLEQNNTHYFPFRAKPERPIKAAIHHVPNDSSGEWVALSFDVINVSQMTSNCPLPHGDTQLVTLSPSLSLSPETKNPSTFQYN